MTERTVYFKQLELGPMANFVYLVGDPQTRVAAAVDPAWDVPGILSVAAADGYEIRHVLATHGHPDHVNGVEEILSRTNARFHMHKDEVSWIPGWKAVNEASDHGDRLALGDLEITFLHTPGHTPGSQSFLLGSRLLTGDTLFIRGCGRTDLPGGDPKQLYESLTKRILKLDGSTVVYPGHNYADEASATIDDGKKSNPYLRCASLREFLALVQPAGGFY